MLVEQQAKALREWTGLVVAEYMGGMRLAAVFDVLVTTPKAFEVRAAGDRALAWRRFRVVVFDEVNHVLKEHPYRKLACSLSRSGAEPRVLGLSASLTYAVERCRVDAEVRRLLGELCVTQILTATPDELLADGYHGGTALVAEVLAESMPSAADYADRGIVALGDRKPHVMKETFLERVRAGAATPFAAALMAAVWIAALDRSL